MNPRSKSVVGTGVRMLWLAVRGLLRRGSVVGESAAVVSLTSYGRRIRWVHLTIESIAAGSERPVRMILWLDDASVVARPPASLRRLARRGLEIRATPDHGPHKKYFPATALGLDLPLVTADDDVLYPRPWLAMLMRAHEARPDAVHAHRVNRIRVASGAILPYAQWGRAADLHETPRNFATGVKGVLYPPAFQRVLRDAGLAFLEHCRDTDDIWLHHLALRSGVQVLPVLGLPADAVAAIRGVRTGGALADANVDGGRNDRVIAALYPEDTVRAIVDDDRGAIGPSASTRPVRG